MIASLIYRTITRTEGSASWTRIPLNQTRRFNVCMCLDSNAIVPNVSILSNSVSKRTKSCWHSIHQGSNRCCVENASDNISHGAGYPTTYTRKGKSYRWICCPWSTNCSNVFIYFKIPCIGNDAVKYVAIFTNGNVNSQCSAWRW